VQIYRARGLDLLLAVMIAVMSVLWAGVLKCAAQAPLPDPIAIIGILLALPVVFVLPGYTLSEAMFHKRPLESSHRLLLSLALSLAIDIVSGLILNFLPGGLQATSWAIWLGVVTVVFALLAACLRWTHTSTMYRRGPLYRERFRPGPSTPRPSPGTRKELPVPQTGFHYISLSIYDCVLCVLAIFVAILSIEFSAMSVSQQPYPGFTQLWMLPSVQNGTLSAHQGGTCAVRIGVRSFEVTTVTYRVVMRMNGVRVRTWPGVVLASRQEWDQLVEVKPTRPGDVYVEVRLYRFDQAGTVYRNVHVTLHACSRLL